MFYRIFALLIVGFWLAMTSLLVVREFFPEATRLNQVPPSYVGRLMFQHHQNSDLQIYDAGKEAGFVRIEPRELTQDKPPSLIFRGGISINPPGSERQQVTYSGEVNFDEQIKLRNFTIGFTTRKPENQLLLVVDIEKQTARYEVRMQDKLMDQSSFTLDSAGLDKLVAQMGVDPSLLQQLRSTTAGFPPPEVLAQQSSIRVNGEKISTYLLTVSFGEHTVLEAHVSPLGQILRAQLPLFGYKFSLFHLQP